MKANLKSGIWLLAAILIVHTGLAQGHSNRHQWDDEDWYEDHYRNDRYNQRSSHSYKVVRYRPAVPNYHVSRRPGPGHIWIPTEYRWQRGRYVHIPGYWMVPPRNNMRYIPGYWQPTRGGYVWVSGFWQGGNVNVGIRF